MRVRLILIGCFIAVSGVCFAQNTAIPSNRTVLAEMKTREPAMYSHYRSGKKMQRTGIIMTGAGGGCVMVGALFSVISNTRGGYVSVGVGPIRVESDGDNKGLRKTGTILMVTGAVSLSAGLPVMITGGKKKKQTFQDYKNHYYSKQPSSYFQMNFYPDRIGIACVF